MATEWVPGEVLHVRSPADSQPNCTQWAASGECKRNPKHMLKDCRVACNVSHDDTLTRTLTRTLTLTLTLSLTLTLAQP